MAALVAASLFAYEPIRHNNFVHYDDNTYITENPNVTGGITQDSVIWAFTKLYMANWHPLTWLSHMLDCEIYGLNPVGHHVTSVLIHTASSLLLFWTMRKMTGAIWTSAFVAAVFALHPLHVESVAWAAERKDTLSGLFWMLTMFAYARYAERPNFTRYSLVLLVFTLGLMSKPMVITLPFVLLLLDWWPLDRLARFKNKATAATARFQKATILRLLIEKVPMLVLTALSGVITIIAQHSGGAVATLEHISLDCRIANAFISYISYIGKTLWPSGLAVPYPNPHKSISDTVSLICISLFVLMTVISVYAGRRRKYIVVGWLWYVGTLVPVLGLIQVGEQGMADRYMYVPMLGLLIIIAWFVKDVVSKRPHWKVIAAVLAVAALSSMAALTRTQVRYWQNDLTLFEHALKITKNNTIAENNYGCAFLAEKRLNEAVLHFNNSLLLNPLYTNARNNLGNAFMLQGKFKEAIECFNSVLQQAGDSAKIHYQLGVAMSEQGQFDDAVKHLAKAIKLDPMYPDAQNRIGAILTVTGKSEEAIGYLKEAVRINPDEMEAYANLGMAYEQLGQYENAIKNWTKALELSPNSIEILNNLAWILATADVPSVRDAQKAIGYAKRACELTADKDAECLDALASGFAAAGKFDEAVRIAEKALNAARISGQENLFVEIHKRMELYQAGMRTSGNK